MWRPLTVLTVALLAGCSGLVVGGDAPGETVTPAPVPDTATDVPVPLRNGTVDMDRLLSRHDAALAERSYHRRIVREGPQNTRDVWVDRDGGVVRVRQTFGPLVDDSVLVGNREYTNVRDDPDTDYVIRPSEGQIPYVRTLSGGAFLAQVLTGGEYRRLGTVQRDGRTLAVVGTNRTDGALSPSRNAILSSRVYVDRAGVVRYVDHRARRPDGSNLTVEMTITTGLERVPVPWWLRDADPYVSGSM
ncbi:hypothetical protein ACFQGE_07585 [Halomicroarcula sp. GCM10025817]|uniref:hypothetical protein n=1 Tax=Haloarcula TaxID=2237 RepID=UPI0023E7C75E|nr:hypothetical protein [Halomicroarcula sp. SYNS111]